MNIVKQFEDPEFFRNVYHWNSPEELANHHFYWGLGDDGELYCHCTRFYKDEWQHLSFLGADVGNYITLKLMKRIVNQFGHLVIFT